MKNDNLILNKDLNTSLHRRIQMLIDIEYDKNMPISVQVYNVQYYPLHQHNDIQIIYVLEGEIDFKLSFTTYNLKKNDLHFVHQNDIHGILNASEDSLVLVLSLKSDAFREDVPDLHSQIFTTKVSSKMATYQRKLQLMNDIIILSTDLTNNDYISAGRIYERAKGIIDLLYMNFRGFKVDRENRAFEHVITYDPVQVERISRIVGYIYENYSYKITLNDIAKREYIDRYYLSHLFKRLTGENFRNFLAMVRVEMSEHSILNTNKSISAISHDCGFSKAEYFEYHFCTWHGLTPEEYRQKYKNHTIANAIPVFRLIGLDEIDKYLENLKGKEDILSKPTIKTCLQLNRDGNTICKLLFKQHTNIIVNNDIFKKEYLNNVFIDFLKSIPSITFNICNQEYNASTSSVDEHLILRAYLNKPCNTETKEFLLFDNSLKQKGLLLTNGIKRPGFYILIFLLSLYENAIYINDSILITKHNNNYRYIAYNCEKETTKEILIEFSSLSQNIKITEHRLDPKNSYKIFCKQLGNKTTLTEKECLQINSMTIPKINYKVIKNVDKHVHGISLTPLEVVYGEVECILD